MKKFGIILLLFCNVTFLANGQNHEPIQHKFVLNGDSTYLNSGLQAFSQNKYLLTQNKDNN